MMRHTLAKTIALLLLAHAATAMADDTPFSIVDNLFDATITNTFGLQRIEGAETVTVFAPSADTDHYSNGVVMAAFKGDLYCMWQSSKKDEDADDTWVAYARSTDGGQTWSNPMVLCPTIADGYCASGGWLVTSDKLVGYINTRPKSVANSGGYTRYVESTDGLHWSEPADVTMADGTTLNGIFEQDPHRLADGRIIGAAHFQPGLKLCPIYTDDPTGVSGWKKGSFAYTDNGAQSAELEPSFFVQHDGTLVMVMRDQKGSYKVLAATSRDRGESWTKAVRTNMPDSRAKQCAGNLPDGTAFLVNNPGRVVNSANATFRIPLALTLSADGVTFDRAYLLRGGDDWPERRYEGKAKTLGYSYPKAMVHDGWLYVSYATNKDDAQYTRVPLSKLSTGIQTPERTEAVVEGPVYDLQGHRVGTVTDGQLAALGLKPGIYLVRTKANGQFITKKIIVR